ncbi:MAG: polysaccharide deacetylase family protein [Candidatus Aenigmarchaeota archaeon]|nr:polysaccharide deacetylase family protein [Candidatus Aenigmarchaeota archaeon]
MKIKRWIVNSLFINLIGILLYPCLLIYKRVYPYQGTVILLFHDPYSKNFESIIKYLKKNYRIISFGEFKDYFLKGKNPPENSIIITFDDGFKSVYKEAFPVILREKIPIMVYLISNSLEGKTMKYHSMETIHYLSLKDIKKMQKSTFVAFGSHTKSHRCLSSLSLKERGNEIRGSKHVIEKMIGEKIEDFSFPYGGFNTFSNEDITILKKAGYKTAVINVGGTNSKNTNPCLLRRVCIGKNHNKYVVELFLYGLLHKLIGVWKP